MAEPYDLATLIARYATTDGEHPTPLSRLFLIRISQPTQPLPILQSPALCIVAQGRKQVTIGSRVYLYDPCRYLVVSVDVPITGQVLEATPERPYLCLRLHLDRSLLADLILETSSRNDSKLAAPGVTLSPLNPELMDAATRLLRLLDTPRDMPALAPLIERELLYRILMSEQGSTVRQIALADGNARRVARAIDWLKRNYRKQFQLEVLADLAGMSRSALHAHFKTVTTMSPLQFQKQLRLQEARRLMLAQALDASRAGYQVGYESPSQFSREYRRLFGSPPARDIAHLKDSEDVVIATPGIQ